MFENYLMPVKFWSEPYSCGRYVELLNVQMERILQSEDPAIRSLEAYYEVVGDPYVFGISRLYTLRFTNWDAMQDAITCGNSDWFPWPSITPWPVDVERLHDQPVKGLHY